MKKIATVFTAIVTALGFAVAIGSPAYAAASSCPYGTVCIWDDSGFTILIDQHWSSPATCYNLATADNDKAAAFYNRLSIRRIQMYRDRDCTGALLRNWNGSSGPFPGAGASGNQPWVFYKPFCCGNGDQNQLTSIWYNSN